MKTNMAAICIGGAALLGASACATAQPSPALLAAREAYQAAARGPANEKNPADLHEAMVLLDEAEASAQGRDQALAEHRAYLALRRAELADAQGKTSAAVSEKARQQQEATAIKDQSLATAKGQLAQASAVQAQTQTELAQTQGQRDAEHQGRIEAEQATLDALGQVAAVRREARGMVITLSGGALFISGKSVLLPSAEERLDQVAAALRASDRTILIEGHTDSSGSDAINQQLSQDRAQSVLDYLVSRGVARERIRALGLGPSRPIAENGTSEGRASNRRVEVVVETSQPKIN